LHHAEIKPETSTTNLPHATQTSPNLPLRAPMPKRSSLRRRMNVVKGEREEETSRVNTVVAICTAKSYDFERLFSFLQNTFPYTRTLQEDVLYVRIVDDGAGGGADAYFFADGCFALWGSPTDASALLLRLKDSVRPFEICSLGECETETLFYKIEASDRFFAGMDGEMIVLDVSVKENSDGNSNGKLAESKLAFSNGLVDSVKLAVLESSLEDFIEKVKPIPLTLANGGRLPVGRADVLRLTGELLRFRADLNLHSELTDTPEVYWSEPRLEELYNRTARVLDIRQRAHVLNKRLDYANELVSVLRSHLSEQHGLKLEWGIIILIAVEVAFETLHWL